MKYFAAYWQQVLVFYRTLWALVFKRVRDLDGPLAEYVMKPGYFWEFLEMHKWLAVTILKLPIQVFMILVAYVAFVLILCIFAVAPLIVMIIFPIFAFNNFRAIRAKGDAL